MPLAAYMLNLARRNELSDCKLFAVLSEVRVYLKQLIQLDSILMGRIYNLFLW